MLPLPKLDRIDLRILAQLQSNGRLTNVELARRVGLSASPCLIRVKRLEKSGYITSYGAQINLQKIGSLLTVFTEVTLSDHRRDDFSRFESHIQKIPSVVECHLVSGGYDYLLKFMTRSVDHYQGVVEALLDRNIGIEKYFSYIVIKSPIIKPAVSIESILDTL
ncbi:Lrp/AsnC family transcriptional regulator [Gluconacetobacter sacchari]|uniref:Lrp/AsnC family transcriptional regulator n=2 Tax=Gluconacetobacter sacchari TaxID=92759 RepID=A0A7W4NQN5_9PROT|nr:Lrp/AsnC family transcriptional regulator [Gluconacetobacter sacchari]MBB2162567.1 Lrp/AsnC family transcriptional regulator [Gluconacetobacter sacchari]GBQ31125.1 transcriptional regulator [Gluconacetobacter sacchari DSM 12717]